MTIRFPRRCGDHSSGTCVTTRLDATHPDNWPENRLAGFPAALPLFGFAPDGVYRAIIIADNAVGSYPTFSPLLMQCLRAQKRYILCCTFPWVHRQARFPSRMLSGIVFPWSPDFPPPRPFDTCGSDHPTGWQGDLMPKQAQGQPLPCLHRKMPELWRFSNSWLTKN